ncbi:MAG: hypothetical protein ABIQ30_03130 [Devosia sp.]
MLEIIRLVAAGLATLFFLMSAFSKVRNSLDQMMGDFARVGRLNSIGAFFAAVVFGCEVARYFWPAL